jgi:Transglutaminase-like superfamily
MGSKVNAALALSGADWRTLSRAWLTLLVVDLGLRLLPLRSVRRLLAVVTKSWPGKGSQSRESLSRLVQIAARYHPCRPRCLSRALCLGSLLAAWGIESELRIGVRRSGQELLAHAWLEESGVPIGETPDVGERFAALHRLRQSPGAA